MKIFDVIVVGELNLDIIMNGIDRFPEIGKEILAESLDLTLPWAVHLLFLPATLVPWDQKFLFLEK